MKRFVTALLAILGGTSLAAANIGVHDLAGHWADQKWVAELEQTRAPMDAANTEPPLAFSVELSDKGLFQLSVTNFHDRIRRTIIEVDEGALVVGPPGVEEPDADAKKERIPLTIGRDANGQVVSITAAVWPGDSSAVRFRRMPERTETWARRTVLAGDYIEGASSHRWSFDADGGIRRPDHENEKYDLNLDPSESCCDSIVIGEKRIGFAWHEGVLRLYDVVSTADCRLSCAKESFVTLVPRKTRPWNGAGALATLHAPNRLVNVPVVPDPATKGEWFVARAAGVEVRLNNFDRKPNPDGFNEPPFFIHVEGHKNPCKAIDTNAMREGVWISADGTRVGFSTWSGSSTGFDLFDAATCGRIASIDATGGLSVDGTIITTDPSCEPETETTAYCAPAAVYHLTSAGKLEAMPAAGRERTKAMLGVDLDHAATIEWPYTSRARIVRSAP